MTRAQREEREHTAEDLRDLGSAFRGELIDGRLVETSPNGPRHGKTENRIGYLLTAWADAAAPDLCVVTGETGFVLARNPDVVRAADVALLSQARVGATGEGFVEGPPDLAVEVLSPSNSASEIEEKLGHYFAAGVRSAWVVDPKPQTVIVYRSLRERDIFRGEDAVSDPVLPAFSAPASAFFR